ncbi:MAG: hypothetical protein WC758_06200 [Candidatus Woesearchaeota archaeon]|jgi:hypothetical protein
MYGNWDFRNIIFSLEQVGVLDVIMPFILIFTIIYAVLQKTKILGKDQAGMPKKNFNVIISLVMALGVVIPHVTGRNLYGISVVDIINNALPNVALVAVIIVMILLTIGVFGKEFDIGQGYGGFFVIAAFLIIGFIFAASAGWFQQGSVPSWLYFIYDSQFQALVVALLVFGIIIYFITKDDTQKPKDKNFMTEINKMIKNP